jgi:hypothetical protein
VHVVGRATYRTLEQVADAFLQDAVRRKPDRVLDAFRFQILVDIGIGEARVGAEIDARDLAAIARHDGLQHIPPAVGAVNVVGTKRAAFQIAELVEHEQRMIAGAVVVAVPHAVLLLAMHRAHARIHVEQDTFRRTTTMDDIDPLAGQIGKSREVRITPDWKEMLIKTLLESCSKLAERHSQISFRQIHAGNSNRPALAYLCGVNDIHRLFPSTRAPWLANIIVTLPDKLKQFVEQYTCSFFLLFAVTRPFCASEARI